MAAGPLLTASSLERSGEEREEGRDVLSPPLLVRAAAPLDESPIFMTQKHVSLPHRCNSQILVPLGVRAATFEC